jgi:hypothetical protein
MFRNWRRKIPIRKHPETLTNIVPTGNPPALVRCTAPPSTYRRTDPAAPPTAINRRIIQLASRWWMKEEKYTEQGKRSDVELSYVR